MSGDSTDSESSSPRSIDSATSPRSVSSPRIFLRKPQVIYFVSTKQDDKEPAARVLNAAFESKREVSRQANIDGVQCTFTTECMSVKVPTIVCYCPTEQGQLENTYSNFTGFSNRQHVVVTNDIAIRIEAELLKLRWIPVPTSASRNNFLKEILNPNEFPVRKQPLDPSRAKDIEELLDRATKREKANQGDCQAAFELYRYYSKNNNPSYASFFLRKAEKSDADQFRRLILKM
jgi:hypothetical protein